MRYKVITPRAADEVIVSTDDAKAHARVTQTADDAYIGALIQTCIEYAEGRTNAILGVQEQQAIPERAPLGQDVIYIDRGPIDAVTSVTYIDVAGNEQTVDPADYVVELGGVAATMIYPAPGKWWQPAFCTPNAFRVTFTGGYSDTRSPPQDTIPAGIKHAIMVMARELYDNRADASSTSALRDANQGPMMGVIDALLRPYRRGVV